MSSLSSRWRLSDVPEPLRVMVRHARRVVIAVVGSTVVLLGLILALPGIPGPGFVIVPLGLAILAIEFVWARRLLKYVRRRIDEFVRGKETASEETAAGSPAAQPGDPPWPPT